MELELEDAGKAVRSCVCGPVSRDGWAIVAILYGTLCCAAAVAAFDGFWIVNLGQCGIVVTLWLQPSKGICIQGQGSNECHGWDSDFVQSDMPEEWADAADEDYKPAFAVFVTVLALAGFMCLFSLCASIFPKLRNPYSQWFSEAMALFIGALALGASARTTDTYLTVADNYIDGCVGTQSHGAAGFITGNICWILGLSIFLLTALPFTKCLLAAADEVVDAAEGVVTGRV